VAGAESSSPGWSQIGPRRRATAWPEYQAVAGHTTAFVFTLDAGAAFTDLGSLESNVLYRFVKGLESEPTRIPPQQLIDLGDPFATELLKRGTFPTTLDEVLGELDRAHVVPSQQVFVISEAGQISPAATLYRDFRFAVIRGPDSSTADLMISTSAVDGPEEPFLQLAAWDDGAEIFNYYMRIGGTWVWVGDSTLALSAGSRGQGCFDSHVNGSVVMKELKRPWIHWQSMKATLQLAAEDPLHSNRLYVSASGAEKLELIIRATARRWTTARLKRATNGSELQNLPWIARQLFTTTTVNLASSDQESLVVARGGQSELFLPMGFWLNADLLLDAQLDIPALFDPPSAPSSLYADSLTRYDFALEEDPFRQPGDTFFAFLVPEPAFEDTVVVLEAVRMGLLSPKFVAAVAMVDFPNPIYSLARARLMAYIPDSVSLNSGRDISETLAEPIVAAAEATPADSPERSFAANWQLGPTEWQPTFAKRIQDFVAAVGSRVTTSQGFDDYTRLAESRRREFRQARLFEFALTLPTTNIPSDDLLLQMNENGTVSPK
jgi:hypothetical protein